MKTTRAAIILIITLIAVPVITWFFPLNPGKNEWETIHLLLWVAAGTIVYCFVAGEWAGNNSQVDRLWSLLPIVYVLIVAWKGHFSSRLILMLVLVALWGLRLTYNFSRHGAYQWKFWAGKEDYRWEILRKKKEFQPKWKWTLFDLFFISGYQNLLILSFTLPVIIALQFDTKPLGDLDVAAAALMVFFIVFETVADEQQWKYQSKKWSLINSGQPLYDGYKNGFLDKGLWSLSRHPNYFAEQGIWISFYLFSVAESGQLFNWSIAGCLLLVLLFQGSTAFTEEISSGKYPEYADYQQRIPRFFPLGERNVSRFLQLRMLPWRRSKK